MQLSTCATVRIFVYSELKNTNNIFVDARILDKMCFDFIFKHEILPSYDSELCGLCKSCLFSTVLQTEF